MPRKIFLSFLGTNNYINCNYVDETNATKNCKNVKYVQEAILRLYCNDFSKSDIAYIFLTDGARKQNWEDCLQFNSETKKRDIPNLGLESRLQKFTDFKGTFEAK